MDVEHLVDLIDVDRLVERTVDLVRLPSVNPFGGPGDGTTGEEAVADWIADQLDRLGYDVELTEAAAGRPNVVGTGPGGDGPTLALVGHTDTVGTAGHDDPFGGSIADGRINGRGTCDMKGALAVFLEVAEVLHRAAHPLRGRLLIAGVADEEHGMLGSRALGAAGPVADYAIVGEPTELAVCPAHKGQYAFPVRTFGTAVHSSIADQGVNAIDSMVEVIGALSEHGRQIGAEPGHELCGSATISIGTIRGGEMVSIVPDRCEIEVDRRVLPGESPDRIREALSSLLEARAAGSTTMRWEIGDPFIDAAPLDTPIDSPVVVAAVQAMGRQGLTAVPEAFTGATDAPNLRSEAVIWGPGSLGLAHTTAESIAVDELVLAARVYLDATLALVG